MFPGKTSVLKQKKRKKVKKIFLNLKHVWNALTSSFLNIIPKLSFFSSHYEAFCNVPREFVFQIPSDEIFVYAALQ